MGRQAFDLHQVIDNLGTADAFPGKPIGLYARGQNASLMAIYTMARGGRDQLGESLLKWYLLRDGFLTYRAFLERPKALRDSFRLMPADGNRTTSFDREIPAAFFVFDVSRHRDLPQLLASTRAGGLIVNPIDGDGNRLSEPAARKLLPRPIRVISAARPEQAVWGFLREILIDRPQ